MSVMLAIFTCARCSPALLRHWPYFQRQEADWNYIITTNLFCDTPPGVPTMSVAEDKYIDGAHLPQRLIDTMARLLELPWEILILAEYDTLIINRIRTEAMELAVAGHLTGYQTWGSKAKTYYHNPWVMMREPAIKFVAAGQKAIDEGVCGQKGPNAYGAPESSPDVFFGYVCETAGIKVQPNLWNEYTRNSFDHPGHLDEARAAYRAGVDVIHGCKSKEELDFITQ